MTDNTIKFKALDLPDKKIFDEYFKGYPPEASEFTFTNLFVWRMDKKYEYAILDSHLIICFQESGKKIFLQPFGNEPAKMIVKLLEAFPESSFERVEKKIADQLKDKFNVTQQRDMFDYVYSLDELSQLKGTRFESKRNFIKQALDYEPSSCILEESTVKSFFRLQDKWCDIRNCKADERLSAEDFAVKEALTHYKEFNLFGVCVHIEGAIEAFAIGEKLNNDTFVEHFEKANTRYKGLYQYVLNELVIALKKNNGNAKFKFLNREQDLGVEGLKQAKMSYHPIKMIEKYRITKK